MRKSTSSVSLQMFLTTFQTVDQRLSWFQSEIKQKIKFKTSLQFIEGTFNISCCSQNIIKIPQFLYDK